MINPKLEKSSLTEDQRATVREIIRLFNDGLSYLQIARTVGRHKGSVVRTVKVYGLGLHGTRDKWACYKKKREEVGWFGNPPITQEIRAARLEEKETRKAHIAEHREVVRHWAWYENRLKKRHYSTPSFLKKLKNNPGYKAKFYARKRIKNILKNKGVWSSGGSVSKWIGCTGQELKRHLESKFRDGMTWENHGTVWEIDHIIPLASIDLTNTEEIARLSHYTNLQPLLKHENRKKSDSVLGVRARRRRCLLYTSDAADE